MTIAARMIRDRRRNLLWWTAGIVLLVLFTVALYPAVRSAADVDQLVNSLPEAIKSMIGYQSAVPLTSPAGYLQARLFSTLGPLLLVVFGIGVGAQAIGGIEESGQLEPLLATPVTRMRFTLQRALGAVGMLTGLAIVFAIATVGLSAAFGLLNPVDLGRIRVGGLLGVCTAMLALGMLHLALAYTIGAGTGRRGPAVGVSAAVAVSGYLIYSLLGLVKSLAPLRYATPWYWYLQRNMLTEDVAAVAIIAPLLLSAATIGVGIYLFGRRDLR